MNYRLFETGYGTLIISKIDLDQKVDWHNNLQIHNRIAQELDDLLYDFSKEHNVELDYDTCRTTKNRLHPLYLG